MKSQERIRTKVKARDKFFQGDRRCYCCGKKDHVLPACEEKNTRPKEDWFKPEFFRNNRRNQNNAQNHHQSEDESSDDDANSTTSQRSGWGANLFQAVNLSQNEESENLRNVLLLDSGSTVSLMCNPNLVDNIQKKKNSIKLDTNGGSKCLKWEATMPGLGAVNFDEGAIANILGLSDLKQKYRITYDSELDDVFHVHISDKSSIKFRCNERGLYTNTPTQKFMDDRKKLKNESEQNETTNNETEIHED